MIFHILTVLPLVFPSLRSTILTTDLDICPLEARICLDQKISTARNIFFIRFIEVIFTSFSLVYKEWECYQWIGAYSGS